MYLFYRQSDTKKTRIVGKKQNIGSDSESADTQSSPAATASELETYTPFLF